MWHLQLFLKLLLIAGARMATAAQVSIELLWMRRPSITINVEGGGAAHRSGSLNSYKTVQAIILKFPVFFPQKKVKKVL